MGRVFEAIRRSGAAQPESAYGRRPHNPISRGETRNHPPVPSAQQIEEQLFSLSSILGRAEEPVKSSAFTAHTANAFDGTALPGGTASRAAGATLNAVRPARARVSSHTTLLRRASSRILWPSLNLAPPTANSIVRCVRASSRPANGNRCVHL